jgi:HipA-like protein
MFNRVRALWKKWVEMDPSDTPKSSTAMFQLCYGNIVIGSLSVREGRWRFEYTDEFRKSNLRPLDQFPDVEKVYESDELWPFFGLRIPSLSQPAVRAAIERDKLDEKNKVELLRRFGRRTIANPYVLVSSLSSDAKKKTIRARQKSPTRRAESQK